MYIVAAAGKPTNEGDWVGADTAGCASYYKFKEGVLSWLFSRYKILYQCACVYYIRLLNFSSCLSIGQRVLCITTGVMQGLLWGESELERTLSRCRQMTKTGKIGASHSRITQS